MKIDGVKDVSPWHSLKKGKRFFDHYMLTITFSMTIDPLNQKNLQKSSEGWKICY